MQDKAARVLGALLGVLALALAGGLLTGCGGRGLSGDSGSLTSGLDDYALDVHGYVVSVDRAGGKLTVESPSLPAVLGELGGVDRAGGASAIAPSLAGGDAGRVTFRCPTNTSRWESIADRATAGTEVWVSYLEGDTDDSGLTWAGEVCFREDFEDARAFGLLGRRSGEVS